MENTDPQSPRDDPYTAAERLNRLLREMRMASARLQSSQASTELASATEQHSPSAPSRNVQYVDDHWGLTEPPTVADLPRVGKALARMPVLGGLLAFARELYASLWFKTHRRSPIAQQIALNRAIALAIKELGSSPADLDQIWLALDREMQAWKKEVAAHDDELLRLHSEIEGLSSQVKALTEQVEALTRALQAKQRDEAGSE